MLVVRVCQGCSAAFEMRASQRYHSRACGQAHRPRKPLAERFWPWVRKSDGCWLWTRSCDRRGYGQIGAPGRPGHVLRTHRVSWELTYGPIPNGMEVCHTCDNPPCCRPDHLFLGPHIDNMADMWAKGRARPKGRATPAKGARVA